MLSITEAVQTNAGPRALAQAVLSEYFSGKQVSYPINPFQILTDYGVPFVFRAFSDKQLEAVYLPAQGPSDIPIVGINIKRPIGRQRYTAAHELCHHIKDSQGSQVCALGSKNPVEKYAESFAAELLMPFQEMKRQIRLRQPVGNIGLEDVLAIAEYFGVSFLSCLFRAAYTFKVISGDCAPNALAKRADKFHIHRKREESGFTDTLLYEQLIDAGEPWLTNISPTAFVKAKYCNEYIYNDSRMEGIDIEQSKAAEIVTDIRLHGRDSMYCSETHKNEIEVAGHACMYEYLFSIAPERKIDIYTMLQLHRELYSCAPEPDYGGRFRAENPLVTGAKFETLDYNDVIPAIIALQPEVQDLLYGEEKVPLSIFIERIAQLHHRLTVIHPFADGNGRTTRAFLNLLLMRHGVLPVYIKMDEKNTYYEALSRADSEGKLDDLYIVFFKALLRAQAELTESPLL